MKKFILLGWVALLLNGCTINRPTPAPIINVTSPSITATPAVAQPIAHAATPAAKRAKGAATTTSKLSADDDEVVVSNAPSKPVPIAKKKSASSVHAATATGAAGGDALLGGVDWLKPTNGQIVGGYSSAAKGVDISGHEGQPIVAAAAGKVVYSGNGLKGYGNLIIIKHQDNFLTAYSHNKLNLVQEGDQVRRGQKIAELGRTDSDKPLLHFELRKNGKPLNPTPIFSK